MCPRSGIEKGSRAVSAGAGRHSQIDEKEFSDALGDIVLKHPRDDLAFDTPQTFAAAVKEVRQREKKMARARASTLRSSQCAFLSSRNALCVSCVFCALLRP